jgi:hypothetical protein
LEGHSIGQAARLAAINEVRVGTTTSPPLRTSLFLRSVILVVGGPNFPPNKYFAHLVAGDAGRHPACRPGESVSGGHLEREAWSRHSLWPDLVHGAIGETYPRARREGEESHQVPQCR